MDQQMYTTMMTEEETPEVGPNDIVIHLVNPFKCGMCELEFLDKKVFKEHIFNHLESIKQEKPSSQIVMNIVLPPETPGGVTVTRDILQLAEDGSIKQVIQPASNITLNQVLPLKELEAAGVLKLEHSQPPPTPITPVIQPKMSSPTLAFQTPVSTQTISSAAVVTPDIPAVNNTSTIIDTANSTFIKEEVEDMSEVIENLDGTFSVAFKGPNNEMQHIQIIRPEGMKGDMMLELTNAQHRRGINKGSKINECDICGKILSSSTNLLRHKMYHSSERPFVCQHCNKGFKDVSNLKKHTMIHNRIFPCHLCKKSFLRKSLLAIHLRRHQARTVFLKSGSGAKEVTLKTFVDEEGTRVEEMSMAALQGQMFEYKKRIMKADPMNVKPATDSETSNASISIMDGQGNDIALGVKVEQGEDNAGILGSEFELKVTDRVLEKVEQGLRKEKKTTGPVDDLPDLELPEVPKDFVKMYQCGHCGKRTVQRGNMMRHLIHHLKDKPFKCHECPKQFVDKGELVKHVKTHTKPYRCTHCNGAFAHNVQLMKHQETECLGDREKLNYSILDDGQTYQCDICQIEMKRLGNMIKHVSTHTGNKHPRKQVGSLKPKSKVVDQTPKVLAPYAYNAITRKFQCNHCSEMFNEKKEVHHHIRMDHQKQQLYQCTDCDKWFDSMEELKKHATLHAKPFKCDRCKAEFSHKILLETHKKKHKDKERKEETGDYGKLNDGSFYCKHCDKKLPKKFRIMNHIRRHSDKSRLFECCDCNKCFSSQYMLSTHKKSHAKLFTCSVCGEGFTRELFLQIHRKKHRENVEEQEVESESTNVSSMKRKYSQDSGASEENSFACKICATPFSRLVIKLNHERKCKEESKVLVRLPAGDGFQCKICQKVATLKHNLMVHIRRNHSDIVKVDRQGQFLLPEEFLNSGDYDMPQYESDDETAQESNKKIKLDPQSGNDNKKILCGWDKKESSDVDNVEETVKEIQMNGEPEADEDNITDERYTLTPGGFACNVCRRKYTDLDTLLIHFKSHIEMTKTEEEKKNQEEAESVEKEKMEKKTTENEEKETTQTADPPLVMSVEEVEIALSKPVSPDKATKERPSSASKKKSDDYKKIKVEFTPPRNETESMAGSVSPPRSSSRPVRSQKIPSRFLE